MSDVDERSAAMLGSHAAEVSGLLDAIGECLAQIDPFDQRCVMVLNTPERRKAHKALWRLKQIAECSCLRLTEEERKAIEASKDFWCHECESDLAQEDDYRWAEALRGLLARLT